MGRGVAGAWAITLSPLGLAPIRSHRSQLSHICFLILASALAFTASPTLGQDGGRALEADPDWRWDWTHPWIHDWGGERQPRCDSQRLRSRKRARAPTDQ